MTTLRKNLILRLLLTTLFVAQLFVPIVVAKTTNSDKLSGFIICTSTGLKQLSPDGTLQPVGSDQTSNNNQADCFVCLTGGCLFAVPTINDHNIFTTATIAANVFTAEIDLLFKPLMANAGKKVRAPPLV